jgi:hypothetical protein
MLSQSLHLLIDVLGRDDASECPEFVPRVELLRELLQDTELPVRTLAMLMQYYERNGEYGKAEDMLFAMLEAEFGHSNIVDFGVAFYKRLLAQSDKALVDGNLPRSEVEYGLKEFETWQAAHRNGRSSFASLNLELDSNFAGLLGNMKAVVRHECFTVLPVFYYLRAGTSGSRAAGLRIARVSSRNARFH